MAKATEIRERQSASNRYQRTHSVLVSCFFGAFSLSGGGKGFGRKTASVPFGQDEVCTHNPPLATCFMYAHGFPFVSTYAINLGCSFSGIAVGTGLPSGTCSYS